MVNLLVGFPIWRRPSIKVIRKTVLRNNCSRRLMYLYLYFDRLEQLLRRTVFLITLIRQAQQDAEHQNGKKSPRIFANVVILELCTFD
jgi:hypothetical protein